MTHGRSSHDRTPSVGRCPITNEYGETCGKHSPAQMPFVICGRHARKLFEYMNQFMDAMSQDPVFRASLALDWASEYRQRADKEAKANESRDFVVYYVQVGSHIKIGHTGNLRQRMITYPPTRRILATEPGTGSLEARRHREFEHLLAAGREWFDPGPDLIAHINAIRSRSGADPIPLPEAA